MFSLTSICVVWEINRKAKTAVSASAESFWTAFFLTHRFLRIPLPRPDAGARSWPGVPVPQRRIALRRGSRCATALRHPSLSARPRAEATAHSWAAEAAEAPPKRLFRMERPGAGSAQSAGIGPMLDPTQGLRSRRQGPVRGASASLTSHRLKSADPTSARTLLQASTTMLSPTPLHTKRQQLAGVIPPVRSNAQPSAAD